MKAVLGIGFLFAAVLGLTAWIDSTAPSDFALSAANTDVRNYSILSRAEAATASMRSGEADIDMAFNIGGRQALIQQKLLVESPNRIYARSSVLGQQTEMFTTPTQTCVRNGQVWSPYTQPFAAPNRQVGVPKSLQRHADAMFDGERVYHFSGIISQEEFEEVEQLVAVHTNLHGTIGDVTADYYVSKVDLVVRQMRMVYTVTFDGVSAETTIQITYSRINEPVKVPENIPLTCDPARTF